MNSARLAGVHRGLLRSAATRASATISAATLSPCDHSARAFAARAYSNAALAYGPRDGRALSHSPPRRPDRSSSAAWVFGSISRSSRRAAPSTASLPTSWRKPSRARVLSRAASSCACATRRAASRGRRALGLVDHFVRALARLFEDLRRAVARLADNLLGARLGFGQVLLALGGGGQAVGNFLLAHFDHLHDVGPNEFHHGPGDQEKHDPLDDQRNVLSSCPSPSEALRRCVYLAPKVPKKGLA